jgi:hypothetical protein
MSSKTQRYVRIVLFSVLLVLIFLLNTSQGNATPSAPINGMVFGDPFGYIGNSPFRPRVNYIEGTLIENTSYGSLL